MGARECCRKEDSPMELATNQASFLDAISKERMTMQETWNESHKNGRGVLRSQDSIKYTSEARDKLKTMVSDLEDNFYMISLYCNLEKIENRIRREKFKEFPALKKKFLDFYQNSRANPDFHQMVDGYYKLNLFLDEIKENRPVVM